MPAQWTGELVGRMHNAGISKKRLAAFMGKNEKYVSQVLNGHCEPKHAEQEHFCAEYAVDYNGTQAAIRAGYSEKNAANQASRMLRNAEVLARVRELQREQVERLAVSTDFVVLRLLDTLERCSQPVPVLDMTGESIGEYTFDSKGALRALELLGKHLGMFEDRLKVAAKVDTGKLDGILAQLRGGPPDG